LKEYPSFNEVIEKRGYTDIAGMSAGIPINLVKTYLQERGLVPSNFDWTALPKGYWSK